MTWTELPPTPIFPAVMVKRPSMLGYVAVYLKVSGTPSETFPLPGSVTIAPGDNWQTKVNANPAGQVFSVLAGTHSQAHFTPKANQEFHGPDGDAKAGTLTAVCDGGNVQTTFIDGGNITGVKLYNLRVTNYAYAGQTAAINATNNYGRTASGWWIENCETDHNGYCGIEIPSSSTAYNCRTHHNAYQGFKSSFSTGATFSYCKIDHNHTAGDDPYVEASAGKFTDTTSFTFDHNYSHDNNGAGCWGDIDNYLTTYTNNLFENNVGSGIFHEISWDFTLHDNVFTGNGTQSAGWLWNSAIQIAASGSPAGHTASEIYNNTLVGNRYGIWLFQQNRGSGTYGNHYTQNVHVHDNTTTAGGTINGGGQGISQDVGDLAIQTSRGNTFVHNTYHSPFNFPGPFSVNGTDGNSWATWQAAGFDTTGSYT